MALGVQSGLGQFVLSSPPPAAFSAAGREEMLVTNARAFLSLGSVLAIDLAPAYPARFALAAQILLMLYLIHSLLALVLPGYTRGRTHGWKLHAVDILWAACIPVFIQPTHRPFYLFFPFLLFVLLSAAYRWGLYETVMTAVACIGLLLIGAAATASAPLGSLTNFDFGDFTEGAASVLAAAFVVGYLGEQGRRLRLKTAFVAELTARVLSGTSVRETIEATFGEIFGIFGVTRAVLALKEEKSQRVYLWQGELNPGAQACAVHWEELETFQQERYFFAFPGTGCYAVRRKPEHSSQAFEVLALGNERLDRTTGAILDDFLVWHKVASLLGVFFSVGDDQEWSGRLFLFDPPISAPALARLRLLQDLVREIGPPVYAVYRLRRLRSRAYGIERVRIARELHDSVIQTLIALNMRIDVLRRHPSADDHETSDELADLQRGLRQEILNVRGLIQRIRSVGPGAGTLRESLVVLVEQFRRDTGIATELFLEEKDIVLPSRLAHEVLRIVSEALANVRKHSGASKAQIRFAFKKGLWTLMIEDDGKGLNFSGRRTHAELDAAGQGPTVLGERVRSVGGKLAIESTPGHGTRLEITFSPKGA